MAASGADLLECTTERPVMIGVPLDRALEHRRRLARLRDWMRHQPLAAVVPTDSPAANWSICHLARQRCEEIKVVHLVAPQLWAWASWRIRRLRRLTDHVLCVLPFEAEWFEDRGVRATFVGHPLFERHTNGSSFNSEGLPVTTGHRIALLPGSRLAEIKKNWPTMKAAFERLRTQHFDLTGVVATRNSTEQSCLPQQNCSDWPNSLSVVAGRADDVLAWSTVVLVVSGTATLQAAAHLKPMVVLYNVNRWSWHFVGRWLVHTRTFSLPNLVGESIGLGHVVPEFMPHFGQVEPVVNALDTLIGDDQAHEAQRTGLSSISDRFTSMSFAESAASILLDTIEGKVSGK